MIESSLTSSYILVTFILQNYSMTIGIDIKVEGHKDEEQWYKNAGVQNDMIDVFFFFFFYQGHDRCQYLQFDEVG